MATQNKLQPKRRQPTKSRLPSLSAKTITKKATLYLPYYYRKIEVTVKITRKKRSPPPAFKQLILKKQQAIISVALLAIGLTGSLYFSFNILAAPDLKPVSNTQASAAPIDVPKTLAASQATGIQIPDIGLDAKVTSIGKNPDGTIEVPSDYHVAGLYRHGPTPGEIGPAIIVGHVDNIKGPGVFWSLRDMQPGQIIHITRADGRIAKFQVTKLSSFAQDNFPTQEVYGNTSGAELRLITCGGSFSIFTQRYSENTVIFASLVN